MKNKIWSCIFFLMLYFNFMLIAIINWIPDTFGEVTFTQLVFNLITPMQGVDDSYVSSFVVKCLAYPLLVTCILGAIICRYVMKVKFINSKVKIAICFCGSIFVLLYCMNSLGVFQYIQYITQVSDVYEEHYVDAEDITFVFPEKKRNLIYITLESIETTMFSVEEGGVLKQNVIPELYTIAKDNTTFQSQGNISGVHTPEGTTWTAGALTALTLGVPLNIPINGNSYLVEDYLPGAYGLGEILAAEGYNQTFVLGSDITYGGREALFKTHGDFYILDYLEAKERGYIEQDYSVWWGIEDIKLLDIAKQELLYLDGLNEPFHLFTLTVDTHAENGYICEHCGTTFEDQYSNVLACSSKQISDFVLWIQKQDFYENTTIVIAGDHPSMDADFFADIPSDYMRKTYFTIINSPLSEDEMRIREYSNLDLLPTTIGGLGITWSEDKIGLGVNLYSEHKTLVELDGIHELNVELQKYSNYYNDNILYDKP